MKTVPTTWDETVFIDGYPGKYAVVTRRHRADWCMVGVNAEKTLKEIKLPILAGKKVRVYGDNEKREPYMIDTEVPKNGELAVVVQHGGGFVVKYK